MTEKNIFFERQESDDCTVHSLNNCVGKRVISPEEVVESIGRVVAAFAFSNGLEMDDQMVVKFRSKLTKNGTFFAASVVWDAARDLGRIEKPRAVPGYGGSFNKFPQYVKNKNLIFLGARHNGANHAVGARDGLLFDSLNKGDPVDINDDNIGKIYKEVYALFLVKPIK